RLFGCLLSMVAMTTDRQLISFPLLSPLPSIPSNFDSTLILILISIFIMDSIVFLQGVEGKPILLFGYILLFTERLAFRKSLLFLLGSPLRQLPSIRSISFQKSILSVSFTSLR